MSVHLKDLITSFSCLELNFINESALQPTDMSHTCIQLKRTTCGEDKVQSSYTWQYIAICVCIWHHNDPTSKSCRPQNSEFFNSILNMVASA